MGIRTDGLQRGTNTHEELDYDAALFDLLTRRRKIASRLTNRTSKTEIELRASKEFIKRKWCATSWMEIQPGTCA
jgi:hypothetical protein